MGFILQSVVLHCIAVYAEGVCPLCGHICQLAGSRLMVVGYVTF